MMVCILELLIWPILIHEVSLAVQDQMNPQKENNGKTFKDKEICLQCEKRRIVVISNNNFYGEGKSKLQYNFSKQPKCLYQYPEVNNAHNKGGHHETKGVIKGFYQQIFDWMSSMFSFGHLKNNEYQTCVNCQKISKIPRDTMRMGRTHLRNFIYERIFNVYRSCGQCPNPKLNTKYFVFKKVQSKDVLVARENKEKQSNETKREICIECSKVKRKVSKRHGKHRNETNFKEYIITEIFHLRKWKENLIVCVNTAGYVERIFTNKDCGKDRVKLGGKIEADEFVEIETRKEMVKSKNIMADKEAKLMEIEKEVQDKNGLKLGGSRDVILHDKMLKIQEDREVNSMKSKKILEFLTYTDHNRYSVLPFWVIFKLKCPVPRRDSMKTLRRNVTKQNDSSESQKLNELLRYSENKQYTFLPILTIFKLNCPGKRKVENKGSLAPRKIVQTQNKTGQTEGMLRKLLKHVENENYSFWPILTIFKLNCPGKRKVENKGSLAPRKIVQTQNKTGQTEGMLRKLLKHVENENYSFWPILTIFKLNCPGKRIVENKGSLAPRKIVQTQNKTGQTEGMLRKLLKHVENENYSFWPFLIIFKLNCPRKGIVENIGSPAPRQIVQTQNKTGQTEGMLRKLLKHVENENYSFWPFWIVFKLNCPSTYMRKGIKEFRGYLNASKMDHLQNKTQLPGGRLIKHLEYKENQWYSYLSLWVIFKQTCPSKSQQNSISEKCFTEIRGNADSGTAIQRKVKLSDLLKLSQNEDFCFIPFWTLFKLKCPSNVGKMIKKHYTRASLIETEEKAVQRVIPVHVTSLLPIDSGRHSLIPFGVLFRLSCRQQRFDRIDKETSGLLKQKQSKLKQSQRQFKKLFTPYTSRLHSAYWLPFSKCSFATSCVDSDKTKLPGYEQKLIEKRKSFIRFATQSSNQQFSFEPFLLVFSPKCSAPKTSGSPLTATEERVDNLPEEPTTKLLDRNNSNACFPIIGIYLRLKCRAKDFSPTLDRKLGMQSSLLEEFSLESSIVSASGIFLNRETDMMITKSSVESFSPNTPESKNIETKFVDFSVSPPSIQQEKEPEKQDSLHDKVGVIPSSTISLKVTSGSSEDRGSLSGERGKENNVKFREEEIPSSKISEKVTLGISEDRGSLSGEKSEENIVKFKGEKMVSGRFSGSQIASSEVRISAKFKTDFPDNVPVAFGTDTKTDGKSSVAFSEAASPTILDQEDSISTAVDASDTSDSIGTRRDASLSVSVTIVASSSSQSRSAEASTSKAIQFPTQEPETSLDYRLQFEATASTKQPKLVALKTSNISRVLESSIKSTTGSINDKNIDTTEMLTTVKSNTVDLPLTSFDTGSIQKLQTTKSVGDLANITRTTNRSVSATSGSGLKTILPSSVKASLPSHSQPYTSGMVPKVLKDGHDAENAMDVSARLDSKEIILKEEVLVEQLGGPEADVVVPVGNYSRKGDLVKGESIAVPLDVVILLTLLALACYKALKASLGRTRAPKPSQEISDNPDSGIPPNPPDQDHLTTLEETPQSTEQPAAPADNQNRKLELETLIAVADIFLKPDGKIGYEIRHSKAG